MSSTTIIACISSAIHDAELFKFGDFEDLILRLRLLKIFVICSKKLNGDASLKQFLLRIEEKLQKVAAELHACFEADDAFLVGERLIAFIVSLTKEMDKWYVTMLECICTPDSISLMTNEILEILTWVLEMIEDWPKLNPLRVQMRFLKSLIPFVTKGNTEARKDLLAHAETIAINFALRLTLTQQSTWEPIDPQVYEFYTQSLSGSKLSKQLLDDDALLAVKNFVNTLMSNLAELIGIDTRHMGSMKDKLQELYERLTSLKIILRQQQMANFDMDILKEIADVVTDAGIYICSLYQAHIDVNIGHQHLLDKFEIVLSKFTEANPHKPIFNSPRTSSYGFIDCMVEKLMELTSSETEPTAKSHFQTIQVELASLRSTLGEVVELRDEQVQVQTLWDRLLEVAFKAEADPRPSKGGSCHPISIFFFTIFMY